MHKKIYRNLATMFHKGTLVEFFLEPYYFLATCYKPFKWKSCDFKKEIP
jgi:hypothetical protein